MVDLLDSIRSYDADMGIDDVVRARKHRTTMSAKGVDARLDLASAGQPDPPCEPMH